LLGNQRGNKQRSCVGGLCFGSENWAVGIVNDVNVAMLRSNKPTILMSDDTLKPDISLEEAGNALTFKALSKQIEKLHDQDQFLSSLCNKVIKLHFVHVIKIVRSLSLVPLITISR